MRLNYRNQMGSPTQLGQTGHTNCTTPTFLCKSFSTLHNQPLSQNGPATPAEHIKFIPALGVLQSLDTPRSGQPVAEAHSKKSEVKLALKLFKKCAGAYILLFGPHHHWGRPRSPHFRDSQGGSHFQGQIELLPPPTPTHPHTSAPHLPPLISAPPS